MATSKLILNADDFGLSEGVSRGIALCGLVCPELSTSVMTCVPKAKDNVGSHLPSFKGCVGLHLQLTDGNAASAPTDVPSLTSRTGGFSYNPQSPTFADELYLEWRTQAARIASWGISIDHIDTHQNIQSHPEAWAPYSRLARDLDVMARGTPPGLSDMLHQQGTPVSDVCLRLWRLEPTIEALRGALTLCQASTQGEITVELIVHPAILGRDEAHVAGAERRQREFELLSSPKTYETVRDLGWQIVRYESLRVPRNSEIAGAA